MPNKLENRLSKVKLKLKKMGLVLAATTLGAVPMSAKPVSNSSEAKSGDNKIENFSFAQFDDMHGAGCFVDGRKVAEDMLGETVLDSYAEKIVQLGVIPDLIELDRCVRTTKGDGLPKENVDVLDGTELEGMKGSKLGRALDEAKDAGMMSVVNILLNKYVDGNLSGGEKTKAHKFSMDKHHSSDLLSLNMIEQMRPGFFFTTDASNHKFEGMDNVTFVISKLPENNVEMLKDIRKIKDPVKQKVAIIEYAHRVQCHKLGTEGFIVQTSLSKLAADLNLRNDYNAGLSVYVGTLQNVIKDRLTQNVGNLGELLDYARDNKMAVKCGANINMEIKSGDDKTYTEFAEKGYLTQPLKKNTDDGKTSVNMIAQQRYMGK